jgi:hypothetical protein
MNDVGSGLALNLTVNSHDLGETLADHSASPVIGARQHVYVDAQGEGRVLVPEILREFLDRDAPASMTLA